MSAERASRSADFPVNALAAAAVAGIFLVDRSVPLGLGVPFMYLLVALGLIGAGASARMLIAAAAVCTCLAFAKLALPIADGVRWLGLGNRIIFAVLLWTAVGLELLRRKLDARSRAARQRFSEELERQVAERTEALARLNRALEIEVAERKRAEQTVKAYAARLQGLAARLVEAQEVERKNLAAELHDRIGQNLSALSISLNLGLAQLPEGADAPRARIGDSLALLESTTEMVRGVMEELHPALLDQYGLEVALRWYCEEFSRRTGVEIVNEAPELFPRLDGKVELTLFRIAQEALTNVAKHAKATRATVSLLRTPATVALVVTDDGSGLDPERGGSQAAGSGWGLAIMGERAAAVGAAFRIEAPEGGGTRVVVTVPELSREAGSEHHGIDRG